MQKMMEYSGTTRLFNQKEGIGMGLLKKGFEIFGEVAGTAIGGGVKLIGNATNNDFIKEVGEGVYHTSKNSGEILGQFAEGTYTLAKGVIGKDKDEAVKGLKDVGAATGKTVKGMGNGLKNTLVSGIDVVSGAINDDPEAMKRGASKLAKTVAIGALSIGVLDALDIIGDDGVEMDLVDADDESFVNPHWVEGFVRSDGGIIDSYWRDGDGDTSIDLSLPEGGGFFRSNPGSDA